MRIALIMDASQSGKNELVWNVLQEAAERTGHTVDNYGQYGPDSHQVTTNTNAILASTLIAGGAADFIVSGCGTGVGACMSLNAMPNLLCGLVSNPMEVKLFLQKVGGNCVSFPYAKGFGWGGEVNLRHMVDLLFKALAPGLAQPEEAEALEVLRALKRASAKGIEEILTQVDPALVRQAFGGPRTMQLFDAYCQDQKLAQTLHALLDSERMG